MFQLRVTDLKEKMVLSFFNSAGIWTAYFIKINLAECLFLSTYGLTKQNNHVTDVKAYLLYEAVADQRQCLLRVHALSQCSQCTVMAMLMLYHTVVYNY